MEEHLHNSIARSVSKQCNLTEDQIKDLFYIFKVFFNGSSFFEVKFYLDISLSKFREWE